MLCVALWLKFDMSFLTLFSKPQSMTKNDNDFTKVERIGSQVFDCSAVCPNGIGKEGQEIVNLINSAPSWIDSEPHEVRAMREKVGNPFEHDNVDSVKVRDIEIPGSQVGIPARIYTPKTKVSEKRASLVFYHGGGFSLGNVDSYDRVCIQLAHQSGLVVISIEYRLAPEARFPCGVIDAQDSFNWIAQNADQLHLDPDKIAVGGDSAGANLATVLCILNRDQEKGMPAFQLLIYPWTAGGNLSSSRERLVDGAIIPKNALDWFQTHYISKEQCDDPRFNVLEVEDLSGLPPAFILTAGYDPFVDEGEAYAKKLELSGVDVRYSCYADMFHGFLNFGTIPQSQAALTELAAVLASALVND